MEIQARGCGSDREQIGKPEIATPNVATIPGGPPEQPATAGNEAPRRIQGPAEILKTMYTTHVTNRTWRQEDHERTRRDGLAFAPPHIARSVAYGSKAGATSAAALHVVDACCGFATSSLALLATIGEHRRRRRIAAPTRITVTLIDTDAELAEAGAKALERCRPWARVHNIELVVRKLVADMLHDHKAIARVRDGGAGAPAAVLIVPPVFTGGRSGSPAVSTDAAGRRRARTGSSYTEFCEAGIEMLDVGGELCAVTPTSWTVSEDYESFRHRLRAQTTLRELHRFKNHGTLWGRQSVTFDTIAWFAEKTVAAVNGSAHADHSPLKVITHADRERWTTWRRDTRVEAKWYARRAATCCHRLNDSEDGLAQRLLDWRLDSRTLEDLGLVAQAGMYDDFRGQGKPAKTKPEDDRPGRSHPRYISGWHVERHQVRWPSDGDEHGRDSANWIADAPKHYSESTGLQQGWYALVRSKVMGGRGRHPSVAAAVAPELATGALVSKRLHVIGERRGSRNGPPGPIDRDLAVGIAAWVTSTPVERASWPEYGKRINRSTIIETAWPSRAALTRLGQQLTGSERDEEIDDACQTTARTEFRRSGRSPSPSHSRRTPESTTGQSLQRGAYIKEGITPTGGG